MWLEEAHILVEASSSKECRQVQGFLSHHPDQCISKEVCISEQQKFTTFLCPTQPKTAKIANRLIKIMFEVREKIDQARNDINVAMPSD